MNRNTKIILTILAMSVAKVLIIRMIARAAYNNYLETYAEAPVGSEYYRKHQEMLADPQMKRAFERLDELDSLRNGNDSE